MSLLQFGLPEWNAPIWAAIVSAFAAVAALVLAIRSTRISNKALRIAEDQEERHRPSFSLYLTDGFVRSQIEATARRVYAFLITLSSRSDSGNSVAHLDLHLTYSTATGIQMTVKIPHSSRLRSFFEHIDADPIEVPCSVGARETVAGWCFFEVSGELLHHSRVEAYRIVITDSFGRRTEKEPLAVKALLDGNEDKKER